MGLSTVWVVVAQLVLGQVVVIDGDTIDGVPAGSQEPVRYRVHELDAPETRGARCLAERRLGEVATARVRALVAPPHVVEAWPTGRVQEPSGRYRTRRVEAEVTIDGRSLAAILVEEGLAQPWRGRESWC